MTRDERATTQLVIIGDLHLDPHSTPTESTRPSVSTALRDLTASLAADATGATDAHFILLGDVANFDRVRRWTRGRERPATPNAVDGLASSHPDVIDAVRIAARAGFRVHIVAGNHDPEWTLPDHASRLRRLVGPDVQLEVHSWILHYMGRAHAQHGNHFHDLNAVPRPVAPFASSAPGLHLGALIDRWHQELADIRSIADVDSDAGWPALRRSRVTARLAWESIKRLLMLSTTSERRRRADYQRTVLSGYAEEAGLPVDALVAIDRLGQVNLGAMVARLTAAAIRRSPEPRGQHLMLRAASRVHDVLEQAGQSTPLIVLAHSHVAELRALSNGSWYANPGRWAPTADGTYPYLVVRWNHHVLRCELMAWDDLARGSRRISSGRCAVQPV